MSSGAIAAGLAPLRLKQRPRALPAQQAAASVGQGLLVHRYTEELARHGIVAGQILLTNDDMTRRSHYRNAYQTFAKLLELGVLPIVNENDTVATSEIRFGDNDRLAALVAHLVHADLLVLLSDVDGLYDGHPGEPGSTLIPVVAAGDDLGHVDLGRADAGGIGTGGMHTKLEAARTAVAYVAIGRNLPDRLRPKMMAVLSTAWVAPGLAGRPPAWRWRTCSAGGGSSSASCRSSPSPARWRSRPWSGWARPPQRTAGASEHRITDGIGTAAGAGLLLAGLTELSAPGSPDPCSARC